jgi:predicted transposase YbfD/YdcC
VLGTRSLFTRGSTSAIGFDQVSSMKRKSVPLVVTVAFDAFADIEDPRINRTKRHSLMNVLVMSLCGAVCGANGWEELEAFAEEREKWFATFLEIPHGVPSADTFRRVFEVLDPRELESALQKWIASVSESFAGEVVAIDGKSLKASIKKAGSTTPLHLLHAWAVGQHLLLGQQRVDGAPGEIAAIPELLKRLKIDGAIVTTDANGCTKAVTSAVRDANADYVLALKGNRGPIHKHVKEWFAAAEARKFRGIPVHRSKTKAHGRIEERVVRALPVVEGAVSSEWRDLKTVVMIERTRKTSGESKAERHYYLTSLESDVDKLAHTIRAHWGIENNLHWMLDVAFSEDSRRIRDERSAENFALVSRLALMMLKRAPGRPAGTRAAKHLSVNIKRKKAASSPNYMFELLVNGLAAE